MSKIANPSKRRDASSNPSAVVAAANNSSSSSSLSSETTGMSADRCDLASLFECPVCFDYVLPPILQCQSGHLVCSNCRSKLTCCPTCRGSLGNIRNLAMEKVASNVKFPCKHSSYGCNVSLIYTDKTEHEENGCEYRPYLCPCPGASCKWQVTVKETPLKINPIMHIYVSGELGTSNAASDDVPQEYYNASGRRHSFSCHRHKSSRRSRLGDDAKLFRSSFYVSSRKAGEIRRSPAIFCDCAAYRIKERGRTLCIPA